MFYWSSLIKSVKFFKHQEKNKRTQTKRNERKTVNFFAKNNKREKSALTISDLVEGSRKRTKDASTISGRWSLIANRWSCANVGTSAFFAAYKFRESKSGSISHRIWQVSACVSVSGISTFFLTNKHCVDHHLFGKRLIKWQNQLTRDKLSWNARKKDKKTTNLYVLPQSKKGETGIFSYDPLSLWNKKHSESQTHTREAQQIYRKSWLNPSQSLVIFSLVERLAVVCVLASFRH